MPTTQKYRLRASTQPDINDQMWWLLTDTPTPQGRKNFAIFESDEKIKALWMEHRRTVIEYFARDPDRCGTRPRLWWEHNAPERLRRILNDPEGEARGEADYGIPRMWSQKAKVLFETQWQFLKRHRLLLPKEGRPANATEPEEIHYSVGINPDEFHRD